MLNLRSPIVSTEMSFSGRNTGSLRCRFSPLRLHLRSHCGLRVRPRSTGAGGGRAIRGPSRTTVSRRTSRALHNPHRRRTTRLAGFSGHSACGNSADCGFERAALRGGNNRQRVCSHASAELLPSTTDSTGAFTIASSATCPFSNSVVYLVARGGSGRCSGHIEQRRADDCGVGTVFCVEERHECCNERSHDGRGAWAMAPFLAQRSADRSDGDQQQRDCTRGCDGVEPREHSNGQDSGRFVSDIGTAPTSRLNAVGERAEWLHHSE